MTLPGGSIIELRDRDRLCLELMQADRADAVGAALALLLFAAETDREILRRVLRSEATGPGTPRGTRIIDILNRCAT